MLCAENIIANTKLRSVAGESGRRISGEAGDSPRNNGGSLRLVPTESQVRLSSRPEANYLAAVPPSTPFSTTTLVDNLRKQLLSYARRDDVIVLALPRGGVRLRSK